MTHMMKVVDCCLSCPTFSEGQNAFLRPLCIGLDANKDGRQVEFQRHKSAELFIHAFQKYPKYSDSCGDVIPKGIP